MVNVAEYHCDGAGSSEQADEFARQAKDADTDNAVDD